MMKKIFAALIAISICVGLEAQNSFTSTIEKINRELKEVKLKTSTNSQSIEAKPNGSVIYRREEVRTNGSTIKLEYIFSMQDINALSIKKSTDRDLMYVSMSVNGLNPYIKYVENTSVVYKSVMSIYAENAENAENLVADLKTAVDAAQKLKSDFVVPATYDACVAWLAKNIENTEFGKTSYQQNLSEEKEKAATLLLNTSAVSKSKTVQMVTDINFGIINPYSVKVDIHGTDLRVIGETNGQVRYLKFQRDGQIAFSSTFEIYFEHLETARQYVQVLQKFIPLAKLKYEAARPKASTATAALPIINRNIKSVDFGNQKFQQGFEEKCLTSLSREIIDATKSKSEKHILNLADINTSTMQLSIRPSAILLSMEIENGNRFIVTHTNGNFSSYDKYFELNFDDIDKAEDTKYLLEVAANSCKSTQSVKMPVSPQKWLLENTKNIALGEAINIEQKLETNAGSKMLTYTIVEHTSKGVISHKYDFKWEDLSAASVAFDISQKKMSIKVLTNDAARVINYSVNGEVKNYVATLNFTFDNIEVCKTAYLVIVELIKQSQIK